jgi:hypothetical protein
MKTLNEFLIDNKEAIHKIIDDNFEEVFSSHDFIKKFSKEFEKDYITYLCAYTAKKNKGIFQTVHGIIAKHLSSYSKNYNIEKHGIIKSHNIFGDSEQVQKWKRV